MRVKMEQFDLERYLADPTQEVVARCGDRMRILCTDRRDRQCIVAMDETDGEVTTYYPDGRAFDDRESGLDLCFAPKKKGGWVILYKDFLGLHASGGVYNSREEAGTFADGDSFCVARIEWEA